MYFYEYRYFYEMRLKELSGEFNTALSEIYDGNEIEAIFLAAIGHVLGYARTDYILRKTEELKPESEVRLIQILQELSKGRPLQYILEQTVFFGLPIKVNESVLIPRPETEELVDWILTNIADQDRENQINILDVGTGSGCIALSLKKHLPNSTVSALDISEKALLVANQNSIANLLDIETIHADIRTYTTQTKFDVIVSNPPYIALKEKETMLENVLAHEPHLALFVADHEPLVFYKAIARFALTNLREHGLLFFEINENYGKQTVDMLTSNGFKTIELRQDMQGKDRMIKCSRI